MAQHIDDLRALGDSGGDYWLLISSKYHQEVIKNLISFMSQVPGGCAGGAGGRGGDGGEAAELGAHAGHAARVPRLPGLPGLRGLRDLPGRPLPLPPVWLAHVWT